MSTPDHKQVRADVATLMRDQDPGRNEDAYIALIYALEDITAGNSSGDPIPEPAEYAAAKLRELAAKIPDGGAS